MAGIKLLVLLVDAATLLACLAALGQKEALVTALIALVMASIVVTLGPVPMGLGNFEAMSTATLDLLGVPVEASLCRHHAAAVHIVAALVTGTMDDACGDRAPPTVINIQQFQGVQFVTLNKRLKAKGPCAAPSANGSHFT